ncbi:pantothenate kinase [Allocoleopsis sp.]|uniref:pantothenate kinase n=1 Tax=Allocoleopsis sp. TaxID=3088169 RepID=UPI002FD10B47
MNESWLALMIGNSRLHWAWFVGTILQEAWDTNPLSASAVEQLIERWASGILPESIFSPQFISLHLSNTTGVLPLYLASVVPSQTILWQTYPAVKVITLAQVPLLGLYPTLGIDRALALLGAGKTFGYPVLVIDAGTALTFTGVDAHRQLIGGAILPGLGLQLKSLTRGTAALPATQLPTQLPPRWAMQTPSAIESGVIYTVLAGMRDFIEDWQSQFPDSRIALTGGDSLVLLSYLQSQYPEIARQLIRDLRLIFWGMRAVMEGVAG